MIKLTNYSQSDRKS